MAAMSGLDCLGPSLARVQQELCAQTPQKQHAPVVALDPRTARFVMRAAFVTAMESPEARQDATRLYLGLRGIVGVGSSASTNSNFLLSGSSAVEVQQVLCPQVVAVFMNQQLQAGRWRVACELFGLLPRDQATISAAVEAFAKANDWKKALLLLRKLDVSHWNERHASVVIACLRVPARRHTLHWAPALTIYAMALGSGVAQFSIVALNNILSVLGSSRRWIDAMQVLQQSDASGLLQRGNAVTVTQTCFALHHSAWFDALRYSARIISHNEKNLSRAVDSFALEKLSDLCIHSHRWQEASVVLQLAESSAKCRLAEETYVQLAVVFHSFWSTSETIDCLNRVHRTDLLCRALNSVIASSTEYADAAKFASWLQRSGGTVSTDALASLTELHAKKHRWVEALRWFEQWACDPARRSERRVTPYHHDCLQLSMQSSSKPHQRAHWLTAVGVFKFVCGDLGVDVTPISRRMVQELCWQCGAEEQAAALIVFSMKTTERRRLGTE